MESSREIYQFLRGREHLLMPKWDYMARQTDITFNMRQILVNWLVEVGTEYRLETETVYLAVSYIDRFLSSMSVERAKYQLVGTTCLFIAAKYEEIYPPRVVEFALITDDTYTVNQILQMEIIVLGVLGYRISGITSHQFVHRYCDMFQMKGQALHLALYLNELGLLDGQTFLKYPPSVQAASSIVLARHTLGIEALSDSMAEDVGYCLDELKECVVAVQKMFEDAPSLAQQAVREKYNHYRFTNVASEVSPVNIV